MLGTEIGSANAVEPFAATNAITAKFKAPNVLTDMVLLAGELHQRALLAVCAEGLSWPIDTFAPGISLVLTPSCVSLPREPDRHTTTSTKGGVP